MPTYRVHSTAGDDLGQLEHPAENLQPGDMVELAGGRQGLVTARVETDDGVLAAQLEVLVAPSSPDIPDPDSPG